MYDQNQHEMSDKFKFVIKKKQEHTNKKND